MIEFLSLKSVTDKYADEIHEAVRRVVDSGWYLQGAENEAFENEYAGYIGAKCAVGCANGLDALILILRAYKELGQFSDGDGFTPRNCRCRSVRRLRMPRSRPSLRRSTTSDRGMFDEQDSPLAER